MSLFCSVPVCGVIGSSQVDRPVRSSKITLMINLFLVMLAFVGNTDTSCQIIASFCRRTLSAVDPEKGV